MSERAEPNLHQPDWDAERPDAPFRSRTMRAGHRAGAREIGASLYELEPGGAVSPYHVHHGNEELLIVLAGRPALRTPTGTRRIEPGTVVAFPRGEAGAHRVANPGPEVARVLIVSTMRLPEVAEYPDTGTVLAVTGPADRRAFPAAAAAPWAERVVEAMRAGAAHGTPAEE